MKPLETKNSTLLQGNNAMVADEKQSDRRYQEVRQEHKIMKEEMDNMKKEMDNMKKEMDNMNKRFQERLDQIELRFEERNKRLEENNKNLEEANQRLAQENKSDFQKLSDEITNLKKIVDAINRRTLLNDARKAAFNKLSEERPQVNPWTCPETDLINDLHSILHDASHPLSKDTIRLFALRSSIIREQGNAAVHNATSHGIGLAILAMPEGKERKQMSQIYQLLYGQEPVF